MNLPRVSGGQKGVITPLETLEGALAAARAHTLALVQGLPDDALHRALHPVMSPLVWDLGHIAAYEDLWLAHRLLGQPLLRRDLAELHDAFETPRAVRGDAELLDRAAAETFLCDVRERTLSNLRAHGADRWHEMVLGHELQHTETMRQALRLGGFERAVPAPAPLTGSGLELLAVAGGHAWMGAPDGRFSYDNERPRHAVELPPYRIARRPATNADWAAFVDAGGYARRAWWSEDGWAWRRSEDVDSPAAAAPGGPDAAVCHVCWFEADAFARSKGMRLPAEQEWEHAATAPASCAQLEGIGSVWEWTASEFTGYPGFKAEPYREYSEIFFDRGYRVLRGWSRATHPWVTSRTFRNWDWPQRRQLFAGVRLAADAD